MLKLLLPIMLILLSLPVFAQTAHPANGKLFDTDIVPRIDIEMSADDLDFLLDWNNRDNDEHFPASFFFTNGERRDTVYEVGVRLRGNTTRGAAKKAFKISFNTFTTGRKYRGVEKLNLNPEKNDPTLARSQICWTLAQQMGIPAARTNHVELYINGDYFGLYLNTEHIDENFVKKRFGNNDGNLYKCLFPATLAYQSSDPNAYKSVIYGRRAYDLKTNTDVDDYSDFAQFIDILNNTPTADLACELEKVFNVNDYLKAIAFDVLTGNWDGPLYNKNNFYLYHNSATDKFEYIPYDLDNTLGIDWLHRDWSERNIYDWAKHGDPRPLYNKIIQVTEYRDRYTYYLQQYVEQFFNVENLDFFLTELPDILHPYVASDGYYERDFGFSSHDFLAAYTQHIDTDHVKYSIKDFINKRRSKTIDQLFINNISPIISNLNINNHTGNNDLNVAVQIVDESIAQTEICYHTGDISNLTCIEMTMDNGINHQYTASIQNVAGNDIFYQIRAIDSTGKISQMPRCNYALASFIRSNITVAINEFMASNQNTIADEFGEFDDWLELYNFGDEPVFLGDKYLSDKPNNPTKWPLPEITIAAGEFLLIWVDEDGPQGDLHTNFKLSADGEFIGLYDADANDNALIDGLEFGEQTTDVSFGRLPNGTGDFQILSPTPGASNMPVSVNNIADFGIELTFAPNPFEEQLSIHLQNPQRVSLTLEIVDIVGRIVFTKAITSLELTEMIDATSWASGLLNVVLKENREVIYTDKLLKIN